MCGRWVGVGGGLKSGREGCAVIRVQGDGPQPRQGQGGWAAAEELTEPGTGSEVGGEKEEVEKRPSDSLDGGTVHHSGDMQAEGVGVERKSFALDGVMD